MKPALEHLALAAQAFAVHVFLRAAYRDCATATRAVRRAVLTLRAVHGVPTGLERLLRRKRYGLADPVRAIWSLDSLSSGGSGTASLARIIPSLGWVTRAGQMSEIWEACLSLGMRPHERLEKAREDLVAALGWSCRQRRLEADASEGVIVTEFWEAPAPAAVEAWEVWRFRMPPDVAVTRCCAAPIF